MERRVEAGDLGDARQRAPHRGERREGFRLVERRELGEVAKRGLDGLVDHHRLTEALAAVDDAVSRHVGWRRQLPERRRDGIVVHGCTRCLELARPELGVVGADEGELEAAGAGVGYEDAHGHRQSRTSGGSSPCSRV